MLRLQLRRVVVLAGAAVMVSPLLPWVQQEGLSLTGVERGGEALIAAGAAFVVVGLLGINNKASRLILLVAAFLGLATLVVVLRNLPWIEGSDSPLGIGLVVATGGLLASIGTLALMWRGSPS